jgi:secondary thiamine-phosphate synthase enzyme
LSFDLLKSRRINSNLVIYLMEIETHRSREIIDITSNVEAALVRSKIDSGVCLVFTLHTTTAISVNEAEPGLLGDILKAISSIVPEGAGYAHDRGDGNAHAHIQASLLGNSAVIPVEKGRLALGTWQRVLFLELDGPRRRKVQVRAISD